MLRLTHLTQVRQGIAVPPYVNYQSSGTLLYKLSRLKSSELKREASYRQPLTKAATSWTQRNLNAQQEDHRPDDQISSRFPQMEDTSKQNP